MESNQNAETSPREPLGYCPECKCDFGSLPRFSQPDRYSLERGGAYVCPKCNWALVRDESANGLWAVIPNLGLCAHCHEAFAHTPNRPYCLEPGDIHYCGKCGWRNVRDESVPGLWVEGEVYDQRPEIPTKTIRVSIPTFQQFATSLDRGGLETVRRIDADRAFNYDGSSKLALWDAYRQEVLQLLMAAIDPACKEPEIVLNLFERNGDQRTAFFACSDRARPVRDAYNFHGQNTSQWAGHAGVILVDETNISTHH